MPASSKAQQRFFGVVKSMQKGDKPKEGEAGKIAKQMSKKDVDKYASTKHKGKPEKVKREMKVRELIKKMVREELANLEEVAKRDYKAEYKKFQSSDKSKKYRAELNKYNRQKGTYGNGDGKDASHKGGKIVGFEKESVNRGRAEKSRLKKEEKLTEVSAGVNVWYFYKKANKDKNKFFKMLSDFRKKHSDTKWMKMLNYSLDDFNENPKKYKTIDDKQNKLFKNLQNNKKVREGKLSEKKMDRKKAAII